MHMGHDHPVQNRQIGRSGLSAGNGSRSGRAPEFEFWNFGIQRELNSNTTLTINYAGSESHFIAGAGSSTTGYMRGLQSGQIDPKYLQLGKQLSFAGTTANFAAVNT